MVKQHLILVLAIVVISQLVFSNIKANDDVSNISFTISAEDVVWKKGKPAFVNITIENLSEATIELPDYISFRLDDGTSYGGDITMRNGFYVAPFSLTKSYKDDSKTCQNDLNKERVKQVGDTNIVEISPSSKTLSLKKGEKKELKLNLTKFCWKHLISNIYADEDLFSVAKAGTYKLYFEMYLKLSETNSDKTPRYSTVKSNEIQIEIKYL